MVIQTGYMRDAFEAPEVLAEKARVSLDGVEYDTMVGTGLSGALVVPVLARALGKHWFVVRKYNDGSHSDNIGEGTIGDRWLFVDDLIDSGSTLRRVKKSVAHVCTPKAREHFAEPHKTEYVGSYFYTYADWKTPFRTPGREYRYSVED